jgi:hypothetical protein
MTATANVSRREPIPSGGRQRTCGERTRDVSSIGGYRNRAAAANRVTLHWVTLMTSSFQSFQRDSSPSFRPSFRVDVFCFAGVPESISWQGIRIQDPFGPSSDASQSGEDPSAAFGASEEPASEERVSEERVSEELLASAGFARAARTVTATIDLTKVTIMAGMLESPATNRRFPLEIVVDFWRACSSDHQLVNCPPSKFRTFVPILSTSDRYLRRSLAASPRLLRESLVQHGVCPCE